MDAHNEASAFDELMLNLGRNVTTARIACAWKQAELAEKAGIGRSTVGKIESFNTTDVSLSTVLALSNAFEIPPYLLLLGPGDWGRLATVSSLQEMVMARRNAISEMGVETIDRLGRMSQSESKREREAAAREIEKITAEILGGPAPAGLRLENGTEKSKSISRSVSAALGTSMLPGLPVLNGIIAGILSRTKNRF